MEASTLSLPPPLVVEVAGDDPADPADALA